MQDKEQVNTEEDAMNPKKMAKLERESTTDGPKGEDTIGNSGTQGVKGENRLDENIGRNVKNKSVG